MKLTNENYYSQQANMEYMSNSQFKDFLKCEKEALAKVKGEIVEEKTDALLFGGYVDAYFSGELDQYKLDNPEMFNSRTGELKAQFKNIDEVIKTIENDPWLMKALGGEKQKIMTGTIAGVKFKIKMDSYIKDFAITTKQECPDKALIEIDQVYLDRALELVETLAPRYDLIKKGKIEPLGCGKCPTCRKGKMVEGIELYSKVFNKPSLESDENV